MAQAKTTLELNNFTAGLITEASPLTFPDNASIDEVNFILNKDGSRQRRLGLNYDSSLGKGEVFQNSSVKTFKWESAASKAGFDIVVIQNGFTIYFYNPAKTSWYSNGLIRTHSIDLPVGDISVGMASVDGVLVVCSGSNNVYTFSAVLDSNNELVGIDKSSNPILIRDLFGVEAVINGEDLRNPQNISKRPSKSGGSPDIDRTHIYNLRNQTFGLPRYNEFTTDPISVRDPISGFLTASEAEGSEVFPSNSDSVVPFLYPLANASNNRTADRYNAKDVIGNQLGTVESPKGYFIIDVLKRGVSRYDQAAKLYDNNPSLVRRINLNDLPRDETTKGATTVSEYAGRVFFSGFGDTINDGDRHSPDLSGYVMFSRLVRDTTDIFSCFQEGDPTSKEAPDIIATDGGFIKIEGASDIVALQSISSAVVVFARNGVWSIQGNDRGGFDATGYVVTKLTDRGTSNPKTVVSLGDSIMYWGDDGIYYLAVNDYNQLVASNVSQTTIQTFYDGISSKDKSIATGFFDRFDNKVRWLHGNKTFSSSQDETVNELVFDVNLSAFYKNEFNGNLARPIDYIEVEPFTVSEISDEVVVDGEQVTVSGEDVTVTTTSSFRGVRSVVYLSTETISAPTFLSNFKGTNFVDFESTDFGGKDAKAFWIGGFISGGDYQRSKQIPYITFHLKKTETGFEADEVGDYKLKNESSCLVSSQWNWSNSANSNKWSPNFQAYRFRQHWIPEDINDSFDNGFEVVETKNKLRGRGKVVSIKVETEPEKDLVLLGMSMVITVNSDV